MEINNPDLLNNRANFKQEGNDKINRVFGRIKGQNN